MCHHSRIVAGDETVHVHIAQCIRSLSTCTHSRYRQCRQCHDTCKYCGNTLSDLHK